MPPLSRTGPEIVGRLSGLALLICLAWTASSAAQSPPGARRNDGPKAAPTTFLEIKLLAAADGGGLHAQQWARLLEPLDASVQIQRPTLNDKPEVRERTVGTLRYVTAVGTLERNGRIVFPGHSFDPGDGPKLKEWIDSLKTYGAQGTPEGQPRWGLSGEQFDRLYGQLVKPVEADLAGLTLVESVAKLPVPAELKIRFSTATRTVRGQPLEIVKPRQDVRGFATATALAILLNDCGLGFRPNRTPAGTLELLVEPLGDRKDLWVIGWPLQQPRLKAAPKLFALTKIEFDDVPLTDLLTTVTELTGTPVMIDYAELDQKRIDLNAINVSLGRMSTSWSVALKNVVVPQKLSREIWQDESGRVFVWITTNRPGRPVE